MTEILEQERTAPTDAGDRERFAHIVAHAEKGRAAAMVTEARVLGTPIEALCGKRWIPSRDPSRFPLCPECKEIRDEILGAR